MDRVTLPKIIHKVELTDEPEMIRRGSVPAGQTLPAWEQIPLDAKFPMIPAPKGSVVLATTDLCQPKHYSTRDHDFDLTDPCAYIMSNDYSALHDPHLKAHFSRFYMRKYLIQNGFITPEGQVVCSLKEFNEYRRYLRKLCLLELAREKREKEFGLRETGSEDKSAESERLAIVDLRARIREKEEEQRKRLLERQAAAAKRMEKRQMEKEEKQIEVETKRRETDDRRRQIISEIQQSERSRSVQLMQKWETDDKKRIERIENVKKQQAACFQKKLLSKWNERRKFQEKRLAQEAERRDEIDREKRHRIETRKTKMQQHWRKQEVTLNQLRSESTLVRKASQERYERRMATLMAVNQLQDGRLSRHSPYRSMWVLERVLRRLHVPDMASKITDQIQQDELWNLVNGIIDQAVEILKAEGEEQELEILRDGAQAVVQWTVEKIIQDNAKELRKWAEKEVLEEPPSTGEEKELEKIETEVIQVQYTEPVPSILIEDMSTAEDKETEEKLVESASSSSILSPAVTPITDSSSPESSVEMATSESSEKLVTTAEELGIRGKSLTILRHSYMRLDKDLAEDDLIDTRQAISNLNALLDDIAHDRVDRDELEQLVEYAAGRKESNTDNIVEIILESVLTDLKSDRVSNEAIARLITTLVEKQDELTVVETEVSGDAQVVLLDSILQQISRGTLSNEQLQCIACELCSLFKGKRLQITEQTMKKPMQMLIKGMTYLQPEQVGLCKVLAGTVLKELTGMLRRKDTSHPQVANTIVCEALTRLGEQMCSTGQDIDGQLGISVIAEQIVNQAVAGLAEHGKVYSCMENDSGLWKEMSSLVSIVVAESLADGIGKTERSEINHLEVSPPIEKIILGIFDQRHSSQVDVESMAISRELVKDTFRHLANIVLASEPSNSFTCVSKEDLIYATKIVGYSFRQISSSLSTAIPNSASFGPPSRLAKQMFEELDEYSLVSSSSSVNQNLLLHENSAVSFHVAMETMEQLSAVCSNQGISEQQSTLRRTVAESLHLLTLYKSDENLFSTTDPLAGRVVNETLKQLAENRGQATIRRKIPSDSVVYGIVLDILDGLAEVITKRHLQADTEIAAPALEQQAKLIVIESFQGVIKALLSGHQKTDTIYPEQDTSTKISFVRETIRQLADVLFNSMADVRDNIDLDSTFAASQLVRQTLQHLSEVMMRGIPQLRNQTTCTSDHTVTDIVKHMAMALSEGSMTIGESQNLTDLHETAKLVNIIKEKLTRSSERSPISIDAQLVVFQVLNQMVDTIFTSLSKNRDHNTDTLVLASRIVKEILNQLADFLTGGGHAHSGGEASTDNQALRNVLQQLESWTTSWPRISERVATYEFSGCSIVAGEIVKEVLGEITKKTYLEGYAFTGMTHQFVAFSVVTDIFNKLAFTIAQAVDMGNDTQLGMDNNIKIIKHLLKAAAEGCLERNDIIWLVVAVIACFKIVNQLPLDGNESLILIGFVESVLSRVYEDAGTENMTDTDLTEISKLTSADEGSVPDYCTDGDIIPVIENTLCKIRNGNLKQSVWDRIARFLCKKDLLDVTTVGDAGDIITALAERMLDQTFTREEIICLTAAILQAFSVGPSGLEAGEMALTKVMTMITAVSRIHVLIRDISDETLPCYEIMRLAYALPLVVDGGDLSAVESQERTTTSALTKSLRRTLYRIYDSQESGLAEQVASAVTKLTVNEPFSRDSVDLEFVKEIRCLLLEILQTVEKMFEKEIEKLTSSGSIHLVCNDTPTSNSHVDYSVGQELSLEERPSHLLEKVIEGALRAAVQRLEGVELHSGKADSTISVVAEAVVECTLEKQKLPLAGLGRSDSGQEVSETAIKARDITQHLKESSQDILCETRTILIALDKTYRDLKEVFFHPTASVRHNVGMTVRSALLDMIKDIDLQRLPVEDITHVGETLLNWWSTNKEEYEISLYSSREAMSKLVNRLKRESKIIGPAKKNEPYATVKITEQRVKKFVRRMKEEEPDLIKSASLHSLQQRCSAVASNIVQTVLEALDDYCEEAIEEEDKEISIYVDSLLQNARSKEFTDYVANQVTDEVLNTLSLDDTENRGGLTVQQVQSFFQPDESEGQVSSKSPSVDVAQSSLSSGIGELVDTMLQLVKDDEDSSKVAERVVQRMMSELQIDTANSEVAVLMVGNLIKFLKEGSREEMIRLATSSINIDPSGLAQRAVDSVVKILLTNELQERLSTHRVDAAESVEVTVRVDSEVSCENPDNEMLVQEQNHLPVRSAKSLGIQPSAIASEVVDLLCEDIIIGGVSKTDVQLIPNAESLVQQVPSKDTDVQTQSKESEDQQVTGMEPELQPVASITSEIADLAVKSLIRILESSKPAELAKLESFVEKIEQEDPLVVKGISAKSAVFTPTDSLTEPVVEMILAALEENTRSETAQASSLSATSDIASKVVSSLIKLMNVSVTPERGSSPSVIAEGAVRSLVNAMERDLQISHRLKQASNTNDITDGASSPPGLAKHALTTIQRVKEILLRIIHDVSASRLTSDQIEDIASTAAGEMMKTFTFEPLSSARTPSCKSSVSVIATLKSLIKDLEQEYLRHESSPVPVQKEAEKVNESIVEVSSKATETRTEATAESGNTLDGNKNNPGSSSQDCTDATPDNNSEETMSRMLTDALNSVLQEIKGQTSEPKDPSTTSKPYNYHQVRSWISDSRTSVDHSSLTEAIATEATKISLDKIKQGSMHESEIALIADAINQKRSATNVKESRTINSPDGVWKVLQALKVHIQRKGLTPDTVHSLVKAILDLVIANTKQGKGKDGPSRACDTAKFLSKILCHLLTSSECISDQRSEMVTERDSFAGVVVGIDDHKDQDPKEATDVEIVPVKDGQELHLDKETTATALCAISIRSTAKTVNPHNPVARNSFRDLHHPDLGRTGALHHDQPQVAEAKLEWVAQHNLHGTQVQDNVDMAIIAENDPSYSCSSTSGESCVDDIDGKLEAIVSLQVDEDEPVMGVQPKISKKSQDSVRSNINTNSPNLRTSLLRESRAKAAYLGTSPIKLTESSKSVIYKSRNKPNKNNEAVRSVSKTPSRKAVPKTFLQSNSLSKSSIKGSLGSNIPSQKSASGSRREASGVDIQTLLSRSAAAHVTSDSTIITQVEGKQPEDQPAQVHSLCGSHSTKVTVRGVRSEEM